MPLTKKNWLTNVCSFIHEVEFLLSTPLVVQLSILCLLVKLKKRSKNPIF